MAAKAPGGKPRKRKKRKLRLSLRSSKMKKTDSYSDQLGWSTDVGRTVEEQAKPKAPDKIKHQCEMCGSIMQVPKPKKSRYTITCPHCEHAQMFG
ncbi:MAG: hypothetical protein QGI21_04910 [Candidatus Poseidoniaceae archaeon]|jgi:hypothetical protein|nr:hypothetical protein [Candidatus Poseidoniaceae archaeon]